MKLISHRLILGSCLGLGFLSGLAAQDPQKGKGKEPSVLPERYAPGEDYRNYFKKPTNTAEYWSAIQFELELGRFDNAANLMRSLLALPPSDEDLAKLHEQGGIAPFLKLRSINSWYPVPPLDEASYRAEINRYKNNLDVQKASQLRESLEGLKQARQNAIQGNIQAKKDAEELIKRVTAALKKTINDPERIAKYVGNLKGTPEERDYAVRELYKSGALAGPYLIGELRNPTDEDRVNILYALSRLSDEVIPVLLAALDSKDPRIVSDMIDLLLQRKSEDFIPHLWYLSSSKSSPPEIRKKAQDTLALMLGEKYKSAPPAKVPLTQEAEKYYQHKVRFSDPRSSPLWRYNGQEVTLNMLPASKIEEYNGIRWANQALQLDPAYEPAQIVLLSLLIEKAYERGNLVQPLSQIAPDVHQVLSTTRPELISKVLDRAMNERNIPVIVGSIRALGQLGEIRAIRPQGVGGSTLVNALNYPDRRVQFAAAEAIVNIPGSASAGQTSRIVEIFRRALAADPGATAVPRVMVSYFHADLAYQIMEAVRQAGFEPIRASTGRELMRRLNRASDIDAIIMEETLPDPELPYLLTQLRADRNAGQIPIILTAGPEREECIRQAVVGYKNVRVVLTGYVLNPEDVQALVAQRNQNPAMAPLNVQELHEYAEKAIYYLARMSQGNPAGYDVRGTAPAVASAIRNQRLSPQGLMAAVELLGNVASAPAQNELANIIRDERIPPVARMAAASQIVRHIQKHGLLLSHEVVRQIENLAQRPNLDPNFRAAVALILGAFRPDARTAGERLLQIEPKIPPAPPLPPVKDGKEMPGVPARDGMEKDDPAEKNNKVPPPPIKDPEKEDPAKGENS